MREKEEVNDSLSSVSLKSLILRVEQEVRVKRHNCAIANGGGDRGSVEGSEGVIQERFTQLTLFSITWPVLGHEWSW